MKKYSIIAMLLAISTIGTADAASKIYRNVYNDPTIMVTETADFKKPVEKWSIGARFDYTLATFDNKYSLETDSEAETDSFSFKPQLGFDITAGYQFTSKWRGEINYGYTGKYEDKDSSITYDIGAHFVTLNGIYTIKEWTTTSIYAGAGLGVGFLTTKFSGTGIFTPDPDTETDKSSVTFAGNLQFGLEEKIADNLRLVLSYKLGYMTGHEQSMDLQLGDVFVSKNTGILSNTFGLGLRFTF